MYLEERRRNKKCPISTMCFTITSLTRLYCSSLPVITYEKLQNIQLPSPSIDLTVHGHFKTTCGQLWYRPFPAAKSRPIIVHALRCHSSSILNGQVVLQSRLTVLAPVINTGITLLFRITFERLCCFCLGSTLFTIVALEVVFLEGLLCYQ